MVQQSSSKRLRSGSLAKAAGVSPDTIRHYERIGILPKALRIESNYRLYPESAIDRVLVVQRALRIGFTLAELAAIFKERDAGGTPCNRVYFLGHEKLIAIRTEIQALTRTAEHMETVLKDWKRRIEHTPPGQRSHLLVSLTASPDSPSNHKNRFRRKREP